MNRVALTEFLNSLDSGSSCELAIDTYKFLLMLRTTKIMQRSPGFAALFVCVFLFQVFNNFCQAKLSYNHLLNFILIALQVPDDFCSFSSNCVNSFSFCLAK